MPTKKAATKKTPKVKTLGELLDKYCTAGEKIFGKGYQQKMAEATQELMDAINPRVNETLHEATLRLVDELNLAKKKAGEIFGLTLDFEETAKKILELQGFTSMEITLVRNETTYTCTISGEHPAKMGRITVKPEFHPEEAAQALFQSVLAMIESVNKTISDALHPEEV